ncbi:MAG: hypothetical protein AB7K24_07645 [Gemmataceae bacterium]
MVKTRYWLPLCACAFVPLDATNEPGARAVIAPHLPTASRSEPQQRSEREQLFDALLEELLNTPDLERIRAQYATPGDRRAVLVGQSIIEIGSEPLVSGLPWPAGYVPQVSGWEFSWDDRNVDQPRRVAIRIDKFDLDQQKNWAFDTPIQVSLFSVGSGDAEAVGGVTIYLISEKSEGSWRVQWVALKG